MSGFMKQTTEPMTFLRSLSKYRAPLMALAIIGVLFSHLNADFGWFPLNRLAALGYGGVDIFFFLSGFGLFYSYRHDPSPLRFYRKRLGRIFPAFIVVILIEEYVRRGGFELERFLKLSSSLGYWFPHSWGWHYEAWFVSAILALYLVFPLFYKWMKRWPRAAVWGGILIGLCLVGAYTYTFVVAYPGKWNGQILFYARIPIFFLGVAAARLSMIDRKIPLMRSRAWSIGLVVAAIVGFMILDYLFSMVNHRRLQAWGLLYFPFVMIVPGLCLCVSMALDKLPRFATKLLSSVGGITLEAYLLMGCMYSFKPSFVKFAGGDGALGSLLMLIATLVAAWILHQLLSPVTAYLSGKSKRRNKNLVKSDHNS